MRYRLGLLWILSTGFACGGIAVVDDPLGAGGSSSSGNTSNGSGSTSSGTSPGDCDALEEAYELELEKAQSCDPDGNSEQCTSQVNDALRCPCSTSVNRANQDAIKALETLQAQWGAASCGENIPCPAIECLDPDDGARCSEAGLCGQTSTDAPGGDDDD